VEYRIIQGFSYKINEIFTSFNRVAASKPEALGMVENSLAIPKLRLRLPPTEEKEEFMPDTATKCG